MRRSCIDIILPRASRMITRQRYGDATPPSTASRICRCRTEDRKATPGFTGAGGVLLDGDGRSVEKVRSRFQGNLAVTHLMPVMPEPCAAIVWQAIVWRDDGSWNQTVLAFPLEETPTGTQLGVALIWDRAVGDQNIASPTNSSAPRIKK